MPADDTVWETKDCALELITSQMQKRRLKLSDAFADFDRLRSGRVTSNQFRRVLKSNELELNNDQLEAIITYYHRKHDIQRTNNTHSEHQDATSTYENDEVCYQQFLLDVNELISRSYDLKTTTQEKGNATEEAKAAAATATRGSSMKYAATHSNSVGTQGTVLTEEQATQLEPTLKLLRHLIRTNGIDVVTPLQDFDPLRTFKVTQSQFLRSLPLERINDHVLSLMCEKYGDGQGNVYYMQFCHDVDNTLNSATASFSSPSSTAQRHNEEERRHVKQTGIRINDGLDVGVDCSKNDRLTAEQLIGILREQSALYRLRAEDYFTDFDPMQKGKVSLGQFESALGRLQLVKFTLTANNITELVKYYRMTATSSVQPSQ